MKKGRKRGWILLCFFLLCFLCITDIPAKGKEKEKEPLKIGYFDYNRFIEKDSKGRFTGYGVEYLQELSRYTGWEYEYVYGNWSQCLEWLKDGEIDMLCTAQYTKERAKHYDYCDYSMGIEYTVIYTSKENDTIYFEDYESLKGKKIGMMKNSFQNEQFYEFEKKYGLDTQHIYFTTNLEMEDALNVGAVDAIVSGSLDSLPQLKLAAKIGITPFYCITDKGDTEIIKELNEAMHKLQLDQPFFDSHLYEKYYGKPVSNMVGETRKEAEYRKAHKTLKVAYAKNCFPMQYQKKKGKEAAGVYVDILKKIAEYSGFTFEFVPAATPSEMIRMVNQGKADLAAAVYNSQSSRQEYNLACTSPYMNSDLAIVARRGNNVEKKDALTVAVPKGYTNYMMYLKENHPEWEMRIFSGSESCMMATETGKTEISLVDSLYLQTYSGPFTWNDLVGISGMEIELPVSIGVREGCEEELLSILNKAILKLTDEDLKNARVNNIMESKQSIDLQIWLRKNRLFILGVLGFFSVVTFAVLYHREVYYRRLAMKDALTGVWNRNKFIKEAESLLNRNKNKEYYLISTDVDKFKYINDTFGYSTGDEVLREEARQFAKIFKNQGIYARIAADEFVGIIESGGPEEERLLIEGLERFENNMHEYSNQYFRLQIKIGIYRIEKRDSDARITEYIDRANIAKKRIKGNLNQLIAYFDDETAKRSALENEIESKMEKALKAGEFLVYYQPKYNLKTEVIEGAEALVRWTDPEKGAISPELFVPLFEKNGFIIRLDFYVYEEVCRQLRRWIKEGKRVVPVSVNVSRVHLGTPNFIPDLVALLKKYEVPVGLLELELTESIFSVDETAVRKMVMTLKNIGFRISIDDFGSGYSSLNLLKKIPADVLKIDRGFLGEVEESAKSKIIIAQVVNMAKKIDLHTVCEGVETKKQADFLKEIHCDVAQGYLFSRPLSASEFESKITGQN